MARGKQKNLDRLPRAVIAKTSWWFDFEISREHLALFRFAFFFVLAIDAFLQISHAPRYGAGDFNVPHLSWLPLPAPSREVMLTLDLLLSYLLVLAAFGVATRAVVPLAALLDFYAYFSSQLDSYQHHYLVVLLLVLACFIPWHDPSPRVKSWALRLFAIQIAVLYLWAAIAKLHPLWMDGSTLSLQLRPKWLRDLIGGQYQAVAALVVLVELFLTAAWLERRLWLFALPVGIAMHVGIELAGFRIGLFSYVMIAIYTLMLPEVVTRPLARLRMPAVSVPVGAAALAVAVIAGALLFRAAHLPAGLRVALLTAPIAIGAFVWQRHWRVAAAHLAANLLLVVLAFGSDELLDYYRFWGGTAKRLGQTDEARAAYGQVLAIKPDHANAHMSLGELDLEAKELDRALAHFQRVQGIEPTRARGWVGEARVRFAQGDRAAARDAVEHALQVEPKDTDAQNLSIRIPP